MHQDAKVSAQKVADDVKAATQNWNKDAKVTAAKVSDDVKTGINKSVSDAKIVKAENLSTLIFLLHF